MDDRPPRQGLPRTSGPSRWAGSGTTSSKTRRATRSPASAGCLMVPARCRSASRAERPDLADASIAHTGLSRYPSEGSGTRRRPRPHADGTVPRPPDDRSQVGLLRHLDALGPSNMPGGGGCCAGAARRGVRFIHRVLHLPGGVPDPARLDGRRRGPRRDLHRRLAGAAGLFLGHAGDRRDYRVTGNGKQYTIYTCHIVGPGPPPPAHWRPWTTSCAPGEEFGGNGSCLLLVTPAGRRPTVRPLQTASGSSGRWCRGRFGSPRW
jgi:hypothetical protein